MVKIRIIKTSRGERRVKVRSKTAHKQDQARRSAQDWETGRKARRIGNPRFKPVIRNGRRVFIRRKR